MDTMVGNPRTPLKKGDTSAPSSSTSSSEEIRVHLVPDTANANAFPKCEASVGFELQNSQSRLSEGKVSLSSSLSCHSQDDGFKVIHGLQSSLGDAGSIFITVSRLFAQPTLST